MTTSSSNNILQNNAIEKKHELGNFYSLFNSIPDLLFIIDTSGYIIEVNKKVLTELGYAKSELSGIPIESLHPKKQREEANCIFSDVIAGKRKSCHVPLLTKRGTLLPVITHVEFSQWNGQEALFVVSCLQNQIDNIDEKYAKIFQNTPALSCIIELGSGLITEVNKAFVNKLGFAPEECIGKRVVDLLKIDTFEKDYIKNRLVNEGSVREIEIYIALKNGIRIPVVLSTELFSIQDMDHFYVIGFDVSQRKMAQRRSKETEKRYRELYKNMNSGFSYHKIIFDKNHNPIDSIIIDVNPKFEQLAGLKKNDIVKQLTSDVMLGFGDEFIHQFNSVIAFGEPIVYSNYFKGLNKHLKIWAYRPKEGFLGIIYTDETPLKESEVKLNQQTLDIKKVIKSSEQKTGQEYYNNMVLCLNEIVKADYTFIGVIINNKIRTVAYCIDGELNSEVVYNIENTPCENVIGKSTKVYHRNLQQLFPKDKNLVDMGVEAYVGTPIFDNNCRSLGLVVSLYKKSIHDTEFTETLFELFASSIGTEMKRSDADLKLLVSNQRYKWLSEATFEGILMTKNGVIIDANKQAQNIFGYELSDLTGGVFQRAVHPDDYKDVVGRLQKRDTSPYQFRGLTKSGKTIFLDVRAKIIEVNDQEYRLSVLRDITQQKNDEQKLIEREQLLDSIFDSTPAIMMILDSETNIERMNKFGQLYIGKSDSKFKGKKCGDFLLCIGAINDLHKERQSEICKKCIIRKATEDTLETGVEHLKLETDLVTSIHDTLSIKTFLVSTKLIEQSNKRNVLLTLDDITARKQMEEDLVESNEAAMYNEKRYKLLTDLTFEGIIIHRDGEIINVNKSICNMLGYETRELVGLKFKAVIIPLKYQSIIEEKLKEEYSQPYEVEIIHKDGSQIPVEVEARYFYQNDIKTRVTAIRDISERKEAEKKILNAILETEEKERASFAQELHDGLGPILSNVQMYFQWLAESDENRDFVSQKGNESLKNAFSTLREISGKLSPHILQNFGLVRAVETFISQIPNNLNMKISFYNEIDDKRYNNSIEITLYRVLTELINNTIKYAQANNIKIEIKENISLNGLIIDYKDDGKGVDLDLINEGISGFGMKNIQSRIKTLQGNIIFNEDSNSGFNLSIIIPIKDNE